MEDDVSHEEKTRRFLRLERVQKFNQNANLKRYINKPVSVLAERVSTRNSEHLTGHSTCQKLVNFKARPELIGSLVNVKITEVKANSLFGEVCN
jgi:tRNA-2-methylthio-N6-dimethylallyladenosine synthase